MAKPKNQLRWVVGKHACFEALSEREGWVQCVYILESKKKHPDFRDITAKFSNKIQYRGKKFFSDLSEVHQGIAVSLNERPKWTGENPNSCHIFLDGVRDPMNLGAAMRSAWLFGVNAIFLPEKRIVGLTPTVSKVASGAAEHVALEEVHFVNQLKWFKDQGYWVYGLSEKAEVSLSESKLPEKTIFVLGAEGSGLRSSTLNICDECLRIPQKSRAASLNVATSMSLAVYEYRRQWPL